MNPLMRYWFIVAESHELGADMVLARTVLDEHLAIFRDTQGRAIALQDRCLHRAGRLSSGRVRDGRLACPYHGWTYDENGRVAAIPAEPNPRAGLCATRYESCEQDGYIYVRLARGSGAPFAMPHWRGAGWASVRLSNIFGAALSDCVENFIDIPHTVFVHPRIFRKARGQRIQARVVRTGASVRVKYGGESSNLGTFSWFLNPRRAPIEHEDCFHAPNVTSVRYALGDRWEFHITSQSVPMSDCQTLVYTDLTFRFGLLTHLAKPVVRRQAKRVIDQDVAILAEQAVVIARYGRHFANSPCDHIHVLVDSILGEVAAGRDPSVLPTLEREIEFLA